jgi:hypothetical protein
MTRNIRRLALTRLLQCIIQWFGGCHWNIFNILIIIINYAFCLFICKTSQLVSRYVNCSVAPDRTTHINLHLLSKRMTLIKSRALKRNLTTAEPTCGSVNSVFSRNVLSGKLKLNISPFSAVRFVMSTDNQRYYVSLDDCLIQNNKSI